MNLTDALVVFVVIGGAVGALAALIIRTGERQAMFFDAVVGVIGAVMSGLAVRHFFSAQLLVCGAAALVGACVSLALWRFLRTRQRTSNG